MSGRAGGVGGVGGSVVFLPGTLCDARLFAPQVAALESAGWEGGESRTLNYDGFRDWDAWSDWALSVLPERFAAVGLSLGGIAAMALLRRAPERITRLALLDTNPRPDASESRASRERDFARASEAGLERFILEEMIPRQLHPANRNNPALRETILRMALDAGMEKWREQLELASHRPDSRPHLQNFRSPTLVGCGESDLICPPETHREMSDLLPASSLRFFPQSAHLPTLESPSAVNDALVKLLDENNQFLVPPLE